MCFVNNYINGISVPFIKKKTKQNKTKNRYAISEVYESINDCIYILHVLPLIIIMTVKTKTVQEV